eukprot:TRINITY_DN19994_c0_g1::TRINITY_DN19994_c0_g1_i1::g.1240::m.1240 TRINITY_DN19994_c0_g1::TRINITY_DN19994_c0_g1_i1::g.1240  ORF type:complete len:327 (+),score=96.48,sp/Q7ZUX6/DOHH_DANRE/49.15/1e-91,HEAT_2/PF13646.1/0.74,HEAT_2/PF13646.1/3.5e-17,HEAT_2/PF13646.1/5e-06,HEAT_2/PF13646.1/7.8e-11,HEAT_PBS/PF03130.11/6,HEAT_PBS/PF03130.11/0.31,HEAT_PBS/PF03130.11/8.8e-05,HEAT_PBS/PF03130.11/32,HEAT_PBS/PF03130.11/0.22,HEAT_PBS/PF03130.11/0.092,HEAT/PF02985.17/6.3e+03,HEAT/PF02985.17/0.078,HEAT/PF02985.1
MRTIFAIKNIGGPDAVHALAAGLDDNSALLKHEIAYVMGQLQDATAIPILKDRLADAEEDPMVRHEAAEALGAIGGEESLEFLLKYAQDPVREVRETCEIAIDRINYFKANGPEQKSRTFLSVDPAPPVKGSNPKTMSLDELRTQLCDASLPLFVRYQALFALRNKNSAESALAIAAGFSDESALFRHELAYVLGQMQYDSVVPALRDVLARPGEHYMVRHEAAEALGAIATDEANNTLEIYRADVQVPVRESVEVALDISEYNQSDAFQYADVMPVAGETP